MTRAIPWLLLSCITAGLAGCSGDSPPTRCPPSCPADGGGIDGGGRDGGGSGGACPASAPSDGSTCREEGRTCEYGTRLCPTTAQCVMGQWSVPPSTCPPPAASCPATREAAAGQACTNQMDVCEYPDRLLCHCTTCPNPYPLCMVLPSPVWACDAPNADPACPAGLPAVGGACSPEGKTCDYGCESGLRRTCRGGGWVAESAPFGCAVSTRRAKRDIAYLDATQVDALAAQVLDTRLATYEYVDPALRGRRHLGFIIEDQPSSYSVDPERSQVDLYGYASMLVAAMQSQQRHIDALEREVAELRAARGRRTRRTASSE